MNLMKQKIKWLWVRALCVIDMSSLNCPSSGKLHDAQGQHAPMKKLLKLAV